MKKKLTLTIEESVKERAKKFARRHGTSVSEMVEQYLSEKTRSSEWNLPLESPVNRFAGSLPIGDSDKTDDEILTKRLEEKYGSRSS